MNKTRKITKIAVLSAIAFILQTFGDLIKVGGFLEVEFSDFPAIIGACAMGPLSGLAVEGIKCLIHFLTMNSTGGIGDLANFLVNGSFVLTCGIIYKYNRTKKGALISLLSATVVMTLFAVLANLFITIPVYIPALDFAGRLNIVLTLITPFNFAKGLVLSFITYFSYKRLSSLLK